MVYLMLVAMTLAVLAFLAQLVALSAERWARGLVPSKIEHGELKVEMHNMPPPAWWARVARISHLLSIALAGHACGLIAGLTIARIYHG